MKTRYIRDPDTDRALAMEQAGTIYYFLYNDHGDVRGVIDSNGNTVATYSYDEFGRETSSTGTIYNSLRYSGANNAYFDAETGLYKMGARYYKPGIGRWTARDKIAGDKNVPQTQSKYVYVENNPVNHVDSAGYYGSHRKGPMGGVGCVDYNGFYAWWYHRHRSWSGPSGWRLA